MGVGARAKGHSVDGWRPRAGRVVREPEQMNLGRGRLQYNGRCTATLACCAAPPLQEKAMLMQLRAKQNLQCNSRDWHCTELHLRLLALVSQVHIIHPRISICESWTLSVGLVFMHCRVEGDILRRTRFSQYRSFFVLLLKKQGWVRGSTYAEL